MMDRRRSTSAPRKTFAELARAAIEKHLPEARGPTAHWHAAANTGWVRWPLEHGGYAYLGLHRHLDWLSGEVGFSRKPSELEDLSLAPGEPSGPVPGYRTRLGDLLEGGDRWWRAGRDETELIERLEWLVLQLRARATLFLRQQAERVS